MGDYWERRRQHRDQERWKRDMLRRLEELDRLDRAHGFEAMPRTPRHVAGARRLRGDRPRRSHGPVLPGLLIALLLTTLIMLRDPGATGYRFRELVDSLKGDDGQHYAFLLKQPELGGPVGWDPCSPIEYVVNPLGAPRGWQSVVKSAAADVGEASGLDLEYAGTSDDRDFDRREDGSGQSRPVLVGWGEPSEFDRLQGDAAGLGGSTPARFGNRLRFVTGSIVLDAGTYRQLAKFGNDREQRFILEHEFGHVLGLDHVKDPDELMNPSYVGQDGFGPGDLAGLAKLHDLPCA